jgi:hypothetical protein
MGLYERIWKDEKNRTILLSIIIIIASLILVMVFASWDYENAPNWLKGLYLEDVNNYNVGLTILTGVLVSIFYFFLLIALATFSEIRANLPSWGSFIIPTLVSILITFIVTVISPTGVGGYTNFTSGMQWTVFGILIVVIFLSIIYIFFTEPSEEEEKKKDKGKGKAKNKK